MFKLDFLIAIVVWQKLTVIEGLSEAKVDTICQAFEKMVVGIILHNLKCSSKIVCTASDQSERASLKKVMLSLPLQFTIKVFFLYLQFFFWAIHDFSFLL